MTIRNSIFSQNGNINLRRTGPGTCTINGIVSGGYNLIDNDPGSSLCASTATDLIGASFNPQLSALDYYGGTTKTRLPAPTSPVVDKGRSSAWRAISEAAGGRSTPSACSTRRAATPRTSAPSNGGTSS